MLPPQTFFYSGISLTEIRRGRRAPDVDWEAIEADYRCGQLTIRQIAEKHNCTKTRIAQHAAKLGWTQDKTRAVNDATRAALLEASARAYQEEAAKLGTAQGQALLTAIEAAAATNVQIIEGQRVTIRRARKINEKLLHDLENDPEDVHTRAVTMQRLSSSMDTLMKLERQAYNIGTEEADKSTGWEGIFEEVTGS